MKKSPRTGWVNRGDRRHLGDIESQPFIEAIRQFKLDGRPRECHKHAPHLCALHQGRGGIEVEAHQHSVKENAGPGHSAPTCCSAALSKTFPAS